MKTFLITCLAALSLTAVTLRAQETSILPGENTVSTDLDSLEALLSRTRISSGMSRDEVVAQMGEPQVVVTQNVWAFTGFRPGNVDFPERFNTMIVVFENDAVSRIALTNANGVRSAVAKIKTAGHPTN